ncbi:uncharacterized protein LOC142334164 [Lycorma delicatula]|uniref:uncharacterized protein LOC142334164 n=1 Tax=Lycorma delicatula TaxID=130591 RepID=UPI003F513D96
MVQIKLVLIILLSVVYYNEAINQLAIEKKDWETYFFIKIKDITDKIHTQCLYHTQRSCYICILNEINRQLDSIRDFEMLTSQSPIDKLKTSMENFKKNYGHFVLTCEKGMPTDTTKTYFEIFSTAHFKNPFQNSFDVDLCLENFSNKETRYNVFHQIRQRYEDHYLSYTIFQIQPELYKLNKKCVNCIRDFVEYEIGRWIEIEPHLRPRFPGDTIQEGEYWAVLTDIYTNYQRYVKKLQTWITTCLSTSTNDVNTDFDSTPETQKGKPLISFGKSDRMEECISYYITKVKYSNLLASTGKTVTAGVQVEFKPSDLIKLMNDL